MSNTTSSSSTPPPPERGASTTGTSPLATSPRMCNTITTEGLDSSTSVLKNMRLDRQRSHDENSPTTSENDMPPLKVTLSLDEHIQALPQELRGQIFQEIVLDLVPSTPKYSHQAPVPESKLSAVITYMKHILSVNRALHLSVDWALNPRSRSKDSTRHHTGLGYAQTAYWVARMIELYDITSKIPPRFFDEFLEPLNGFCTVLETSAELRLHMLAGRCMTAEGVSNHLDTSFCDHFFAEFLLRGFHSPDLRYRFPEDIYLKDVPTFLFHTAYREIPRRSNHSKRRNWHNASVRIQRSGTAFWTTEDAEFGKDKAKYQAVVILENSSICVWYAKAGAEWSMAEKVNTSSEGNERKFLDEVEAIVGNELK